MSYSVDLSVLARDFAGIRQAGYNKVIVRAYRSNGQFDQNCIQNLNGAVAAGLPVEVYMFPRFRSGNPQNQVQNLLAGLGQYSNLHIWVDIEIRDPHWSQNQNENRTFISALFDTLDMAGASWGVYTNRVQWGEIVGQNWTGGATHPLWYAHYDGQDNFNSFVPFGGWNRPMMKQYRDNAIVTGVKVDLNWQP